MASLDFLAPPRRFWRAWWWAYTRGVLPVAGLVTGGRPWYRVGRFLGPNISEQYRRFPVSSLVDSWRRAGFDDVRVRTMSLGGGIVMRGTRRP
jgi:demethylmenaquinone methyltransferase/2-methoxy-6-polyprenyl-1,4-benzoquinol methylase